MHSKPLTFLICTNTSCETHYLLINNKHVTVGNSGLFPAVGAICQDWFLLCREFFLNSVIRIRCAEQIYCGFVSGVRSTSDVVTWRASRCKFMCYLSRHVYYVRAYLTVGLIGWISRLVNCDRIRQTNLINNLRALCKASLRILSDRLEVGRHVMTSFHDCLHYAHMINDDYRSCIIL